MDTTVSTVEPEDFGVGEAVYVKFPDSKYLVDDRGDLYVHRPEDGNVGTFPHGTWRAVVRGAVTTDAGLTAVTR